MGEAPCLPPPGADPTIPFNVSGNACTAEATGWISLNETVRLYHKPTPAQSCADPSHPCLFNLKDDPLEENNLFGETSPAVVEALRKTRELLEGFNRSLIPDQVQPCDMKSCPKNFEPQGCKYKTRSSLLLPTGNIMYHNNALKYYTARQLE